MREISPGLKSAADAGRGLATLSAAVAAGAGRDAVRDDVLVGRARRVHRGVYLVEGIGGPDPWLAERSAFVHLGPSSCLVLASAAALHGLAVSPGRRPPQLAVPPGMEKRQRSGVELHFWAIPDEHRIVIDGIAVTSLPLTLADCARLLPRMQAVSCLDSAIHLGLIEPEELDALVPHMARRPRAHEGRRRLREARPGAQSPLETRVRLRASDGGFPPDALQVPIRSSGAVLLGYADMGYELPDGTWLVVEADGQGVHELPEALLHDRRRQNAFLSSRVTSILRFTWEDTRQPGYIPGVLAAALGKAGWTPGRGRA